MTKIDKDELFNQVNQFLKSKGIELQQGSYSRTIEKGCQLLADTINLGQQAVERARSEFETKLEQARDVIHSRTSPPKPPVQSKSPPSASASSTPPRIRRAASNARSAPEKPRRKRSP